MYRYNYKKKNYRKNWRYNSKRSTQGLYYNSSYKKSLELIRTEFFNFDRVTFKKFSNFYSQKYGESKMKYMRQTYSKWKSGKTNMAKQTEFRILKCVPPYLSIDKQFELISYQVPSIIKQQKNELIKRRINASDLENTYKKFIKVIMEKEYQLDWFVKEVFSKEEVSEFLIVYKITMIECLRQSYEQVRKDLMEIIEIFPNIDCSIEFSYKIMLLETNINVDVFPIPGREKIDVDILKSNLVSKFKDKYKKILINHTLEQLKKDEIGSFNQKLSLYDIKKIINKIKNTSFDQEYDTKIIMEGHGGNFQIKIQRKNIVRMRYEVVKQTIKFFITSGLSGIIMYKIYSIQNFEIILLFGIFFIIYLGINWSKLNKLRWEVKDYERKRGERFTTN